MGLALRKKPLNLDFDLHPKQLIALETEANEVMYGGAAGGGKSFLMRCAAVTWCASIPGLQVYLFRRVYVDLIKNHMEGPKGFRAMLAPWIQAGFCRIVEDEIRFWNGSKIYLCHCKDAKDIYKYQGAEIHVLLIDELTHWQEDMYRFLRGRVRMVGLAHRLSSADKARFPRILCSANPGNIGHLWVKETFVDQGTFTIIQQGESEGSMRRQFIPATVDDNPSLKEDDPTYEARLTGLGSAALVKAMRDGDWNIVEGAFFDEWSNVRHVVPPFAIPKDWTRFLAVDWGSARPFSVGWYAIAGDDYPIIDTRGRVSTIPRGSLIRYREWYGVKIDTETGRAKANTGIKIDIEAFSAGIRERSANDNAQKIKYLRTVVDPSMFQQSGGPSLAERMVKAKIKNVVPADNTRVTQRGAMGGWDQMRARLRGLGWDNDNNCPGPNWQPTFYVFSTCTHFIRTVPVLQHDPDRPEDVDTDGEDHAADEGRYACMSRPFVPEPVEEKPVDNGLVYEVKIMPDGSSMLTANKTVMQIVQEKERARKRRHGRRK